MRYDTVQHRHQWHILHKEDDDDQYVRNSPLYYSVRGDTRTRRIHICPFIQKPPFWRGQDVMELPGVKSCDICHAGLRSATQEFCCVFKARDCLPKHATEPHSTTKELGYYWSSGNVQSFLQEPLRSCTFAKGFHFRFLQCLFRSLGQADCFIQLLLDFGVIKKYPWRCEEPLTL